MPGAPEEDMKLLKLKDVFATLENGISVGWAERKSGQVIIKKMGKVCPGGAIEVQDEFVEVVLKQNPALELVEDIAPKPSLIDQLKALSVKDLNKMFEDAELEVPGPRVNKEDRIQLLYEAIK